MVLVLMNEIISSVGREQYNKKQFSISEFTGRK